MKRFFKSLVLVAFVIGTALPAWSQASTQGKEFWVSSTIVCSPDKATATPYIAISAEKQCVVTISGGVNNAINITQTLSAGSWNEFCKGQASSWYPVQLNNASDLRKAAGQKNMYGLHISSTENVSVYVVLASPHSMDACNILPMTALKSEKNPGTEYYTQDYWPNLNGFDNPISMITVLATEDNTRVTITPNGNTLGDGGTGTHASGVPYNVTLEKKGQTYYIMSEGDKQITGTHIVSDKPVAVYNGVPLTRIPAGISARDCLFEQAMPVDKWGTMFVATRSLQKDGNIIAITASSDQNTEVKIDGVKVTDLSQGETYYVMLQGPADPMSNKPGEQRVDKIITADAIYIETSCPCAVFSYDTGNSFKGSTGSEINSGKGDPSSVWIAPIEQNIDQITFGTCYTDKTKDHFLNVIAETETCQETKLEVVLATGNTDKSDLLSWTQVPGNPDYSYARAQIGTSSSSNEKVFRLSNPKGVLAIVYGNGDDESYAYSAGSAAVDIAVKVNSVSFGKGYVYSKKFCLEGEPFTFDFRNTLPTRTFEQIYLTFGDGTDTTFYARDVIEHEYKTPGWYDIHVDLIYYEKSCSFIPEAQKEAIDFSFQIAEKEYVFVGEDKKCEEPDYTGPLNTRFDTVPTDECWRNEVRIMHVGIKTISKDTVKAQDTYYEPLNGQTYPLNQQDPSAYHVDIEVNLGEINRYTCDSILYRHIDIITCLKMTIPNDSGMHHACYGNELIVPYKYEKGDIGEAFVLINGKKTIVKPEEGKIVIPTEAIKPGKYATTISIEDPNCEKTLEFPIDFIIYYPKDIFKYKFNNVLAVYKPGYGGNEDLKTTFTAYQWYFNDEPIEGATESIYQTENQMPEGEYYVVLTDKNGVSLPSCSQVVKTVDVSPKASAPAKKVLMNNRIYIEIGNELYDIYGQKVK